MKKIKNSKLGKQQDKFASGYYTDDPRLVLAIDIVNRAQSIPDLIRDLATMFKSCRMNSEVSDSSLSESGKLVHNILFVDLLNDSLDNATNKTKYDNSSNNQVFIENDKRLLIIEMLLLKIYLEMSADSVAKYDEIYTCESKKVFCGLLKNDFLDFLAKNGIVTTKLNFSFENLNLSKYCLVKQKDKFAISYPGVASELLNNSVNFRDNIVATDASNWSKCVF